MASKSPSSIRRSYDASTTNSYVQRLCSSWLLPPIALFGYRAAISLYAFVVLFTTLGWFTTHHGDGHADRSFSYFTNLTYWGLAFYFAFAAAHTASYAFRGRIWLESWCKALKWLHSALYATITIYPFIVTSVFWGGSLSAGAFRSRFIIWSNISKHALNSVFALLEILLTRSDPHPWFQLVPITVIVAFYLALAYLSHTTKHFYVYNFLNPAIGRGWVAAACVGILIAMVLGFAIVRYLILLRKWFTEKKLGMTGKTPRRTASRAVEEVHELEELSKSGVVV